MKDRDINCKVKDEELCPLSFSPVSIPDGIRCDLESCICRRTRGECRPEGSAGVSVSVPGPKKKMTLYPPCYKPILVCGAIRTAACNSCKIPKKQLEDEECPDFARYAPQSTPVRRRFMGEEDDDE